MIIPALRTRSQQIAVIVFCTAGSVLVGGLSALYPKTAIGLVACVVLVLALQAPLLRILILIGGGLYVFQSSDALTATKVGYLGAALTILVFATGRQLVVGHRAGRGLDRIFFNWTIVGWAFALYATALGEVNGAPTASIARDIAPYVFLAAAAAIAVDSSNDLSALWLERVLVGAGGLAALSFAITWIDRRGIGVVPLRHLLLPSPTLAFSLILYALAKAYLAHRRRFVWGALAAVTTTLLIVTGTRSVLVILLAPLSLWCFGGRQTIPFSRIARLVVPIALVGAGLLILLSMFGAVRAADAAHRLSSVRAAVLAPNADNSYQERAIEGRLALTRFEQHPLVGTGPGFVFEWSTRFGRLKSGLTIDTPLSLLAKFGVFGALLAIAVFGAVRRVVRASGDGQYGAAGLALCGLLVLWIVSLPFGLPFEDKGCAFSLMLLFALLRRESLGPSEGKA
jgi:hypothetical protein